MYETLANQLESTAVTVKALIVKILAQRIAAVLVTLDYLTAACTFHAAGAETRRLGSVLICHFEVKN